MEIKNILLFNLILISTLALPYCKISPTSFFNLTITNATPITHVMTIDVVTNETANSYCRILIYDNTTAIEDITPVTIKTPNETLNFVQSLKGDFEKLKLTELNTMHYDLWLSPWKYRADSEYECYVQCGTSCDHATFYVDQPRFIPLERLVENIVIPLLKNPEYYITSYFLIILFLIIIVNISTFIFKILL